MKTLYALKSLFVISGVFFAATAFAEDPYVKFGNLSDGQKVKSPVQVVMQVVGMEVKPLAEPKPGEGHHHLIIDGGPVAKGDVVPADAQHVHFGKGQTETKLDLAPGEHTLTLQFADGVHRSYGPELSTTIRITVE